MHTCKLINGLRDPVKAWQYLKSILNDIIAKIIYIFLNNKVPHITDSYLEMF